MPPTASILAFQLPEFANAGMLWGLAAAAAPWLIHLLSRRRFREMPWAATEFLLSALEESKRRMRLEQWLLLALRTLLIVLVVLALAEPRMPTSGPTPAVARKTHHVFVLDGSYSMAYQPTDKSRFNRAREIIARIVQEAPEGDAFSLVLMSGRPRIVVGMPAFRRDDFLQEVERLKLPHGGADLPRALVLVEEVLAMAKHEARRLDRSQVCFLTDLHRVSWDVDRLDAVVRDAIAERIRRLAKSADAALVDVGQRDAENVAITSLRCDEPLVTPGQPVEIRADLKNFGRQSRQRQPVEMLVDGNRAGRQQVAIAPGGEAGVSFSCHFDSAGDHAVEVRTDGDRLDVDNHRYLVIPVKQEVRVLCVEGRQSGYLATAPAPRGEEGEKGRKGEGEMFPLPSPLLPFSPSPPLPFSKPLPSPALIRPEVVPEIALLERRLADYDCVILSNVAQFTPDEAKALDAYLRGGGSLILFLGDRVRAENYNEQLGGTRDEGRGTRDEGLVSGPSPLTPHPSPLHILPARIGGLVTQPESRLDPLDYQHPIVRPFRGREKAGLLTTPVFRHFQLLLPHDHPADGARPARKVLALPGGDPLIVEEQVRGGRVILVGTSADASWNGEWTPLPLWPSFLPLVHEMLAYAVGGQMQRRNVLVGEPLGDSADTSQSGFCVVDDHPSDGARPPASRPEKFAVNVDTAESDLAVVSADEASQRVWPGMTVVAGDEWRRLGEEPAAAEERPVDWAQGLVYAALMVLVMETYFARRFGHHAP